MITPSRPAKIVVATGRTNCRLSDGGQFCEPKAGLIESGPFSLRYGNDFPGSVRLGFVGPAQLLEAGHRWFERCQQGILAGKSNRQRHPDFPPFEEVFRTKLDIQNRWSLAGLYAKSNNSNGCPRSGAAPPVAGVGRFFTVRSWPRHSGTPGRAVSATRRLPRSCCLKCVKSSLEQYREAIEASPMTQSTKQTRYGQAAIFVRWLKRDYYPGQGLERPRR